MVNLSTSTAAPCFFLQFRVGKLDGEIVHVFGRSRVESLPFPVRPSQSSIVAMAEPAQKKARTSRTFLFSSESVNEGHPDKICDQVSDAVLDACLKVDPKSKVACETATKDNMVMVAGEITTEAKLDYDKVVRGVVAQIGFDSFVDDLSSVDSKGLSHKSCEVLVRINKQSPDIAGGVHVNKEDLDVGAGDQGNKVRFRNQISTLPQPNFDDSATKIRYASATKKRRFRNKKKIPQPKKDDSETKTRRFRNQKQTIPQPKSARFGNQNPRHFATKICASTLCMASSPSATLNMASSSDAVGWGGVGWGGVGQ